MSIAETLLEVVFATKAKGTAAEGLTNKPIASVARRAVTPRARKAPPP